MRLTDLADEMCLACGKPLPEDARSNRKYCSKKCARWLYGTFETAAIRRSKRGRTCAHCGQPVSLDLQASAIYCSEECRRTAMLHRQLVPGRPCIWCGTPVAAERRYAATCSERCRRAMAAAKRPPRYSKRPTIPCAWCGEEFLQKRNSNLCCSRSCAARERMSRFNCAETTDASVAPKARPTISETVENHR